MPTGISYNFQRDFGAIVNIPDAFRNIKFTSLGKGNIDDYPSKNDFIPLRIVINFELSDPNKEDPDEKICIPASVTVFIEKEDIENNLKIDDLNIADWDGNNWNRLTFNLERWEFPSPIKFNGVEYIGYIKADTCISGDPPIAIGT